MEFCPECGNIMSPKDGVYFCSECEKEVNIEEEIKNRSEAKGSDVVFVDNKNAGKNTVKKPCPECDNDEAVKKERTAGIAGDAKQVQYFECTECGATWQ
ncbi:MAG: DNA-directed RNA polymerase subunit M/Transcription elongation factor TFIIS [Candidatus Methanohalarchaeum thermophilum]|uniref:DNA-directed RNA polymerase subunit M/Transcription elongation factor TFIIS n=1 Tax=Methanohalarchaeum thermophilum TaxID=1903181 RepID=A0A1Q6DWD2_METT1|nr:MAG: DNA-directed RNA polymerase subunit M/Transcription elongation factor TFIIS [Candidatus Methanohalarchaeum thermophilum]